MRYYLEDIIGVVDRDSDFDFSNILLDEKLYKEKNENILWKYDTLYNPSKNAKPLRISFNKIDGFIKTHNLIRCLVLFDYGWFDKICDRIKYLMSEKTGTIDSIKHNFEKSELIHLILYLLKKH